MKKIFIFPTRTTWLLHHSRQITIKRQFGPNIKTISFKESSPEENFFVNVCKNRLKVFLYNLLFIYYKYFIGIKYV